MEILTLQQAIKLKLKKYYGKSCKKGHDGWRSTTGGYCIECKKIGGWRRWIKEYPESMRVCAANRRARKLGNGGYHTKEDILDLLKKQKGKCINCLCLFKKTGYHVDHIMPLCRGGSNGKENLQLLCPHCNSTKQAKHPLDFARENGKLL